MASNLTRKLRSLACTGLATLVLAGSSYGGVVFPEDDGFGVRSYGSEKNIEVTSEKVLSREEKREKGNREINQYVQECFDMGREKNKEELESLYKLKEVVGETKWDSIPEAIRERKEFIGYKGGKFKSTFSEFEKSWIKAPDGVRSMVKDIYFNTDRFEDKISESDKNKLSELDAKYLDNIVMASEKEFEVIENNVRESLPWGAGIDVRDSKSFSKADRIRIIMGLHHDLRDSILESYRILPKETVKKDWGKSEFIGPFKPMEIESPETLRGRNKRNGELLTSFYELRKIVDITEWDSIPDAYTKRPEVKDSRYPHLFLSKFEKDWVNGSLEKRMMLREIHSDPEGFVQERVDDNSLFRGLLELTEFLPMFNKMFNYRKKKGLDYDIKVLIDEMKSDPEIKMLFDKHDISDSQAEINLKRFMDEEKPDPEFDKFIKSYNLYGSSPSGKIRMVLDLAPFLEESILEAYAPPKEKEVPQLKKRVRKKRTSFKELKGFIEAPIIYTELMFDLMEHLGRNLEN